MKRLPGVQVKILKDSAKVEHLVLLIRPAEDDRLAAPERSLESTYAR